MRCFQIIACAVCLLAVSAQAQEWEGEGVPRPGQAVEALPGQRPEIVLTSEPDAAPAEAAPEPTPLPTGTRDPFWPVGFVPPVERKVVDQPTATTADTAVQVVEPKLDPPQWDVAIKTLAIKGVMRSGAGYMAVINGQVTSENETISTVFKGRTYSWRIAKIGKEGVRFERLELAE